MAVHHRPRAVWVQLGQGLRARRDHQVAAQQQVRVAGGYPHGMDPVLGRGDPDMAHHGAEFLRQPRLVQGRAALALEVGGHGQDGTHGENPGPADAGHQHVPGAFQVGFFRLRKHDLHLAGDADRRLFQPGAGHCHETGAEPVQAAEVLVAGVLVDLPLYPEFRFLRNHRQAVGLRAAVAAALADRRVDEDPGVAFRHQPALPPAALFRGAGLVEHDYRGSRHFPDLQEKPVVVLLRMQGDVPEPGKLLPGPCRVLRHHRDALDTLGPDLGHHLFQGQAAVHVLPSGHGDCVVVENAVGDVDAGGDGGPDGEYAGMEIGAVADVLEGVRSFREGRLADPGSALAAHLGEQLGVAVHPAHHVVAADAGMPDASLRHPGGGVVGAAGTEVRRACHGGRRGLQPPLLGIEKLQPFADRRAVVELHHPGADRAGHHRRGQLGQVGDQVPALFIEFAHHPRTFRHRPVVQLPRDLVLEDAALFLHHQDLLQPPGEFMGRNGFQGPAHADLVDPKADRGSGIPVDAEIPEGLQHIQVGLAGGDDAETRIGGVQDNPVQVVDVGERPRRVDSVLVQEPLLLQCRGWPLGIQSPRGHLEVRRHPDVHAVRAEIGGNGGVHVLRDGLQPHPAAAVARQRPAVQAVVQHVLHVGGIQYRHRGTDEHVLALMGNGGGFAGMVVAGDHEHTAVPGGAEGVGVLDHVHAPVHPGALAVPHGEHPVVLRPRQQPHLLGAPDRGGRQVLVDAGLEADVVGLELPAGLVQGHVQRAHRRAAVARDEPGGVQARVQVELVLDQRQPDQGLDSGEIGAVPGQIELVLERDLFQHFLSPACPGADDPRGGLSGKGNFSQLPAGHGWWPTGSPHHTLPGRYCKTLPSPVGIKSTAYRPARRPVSGPAEHLLHGVKSGPVNAGPARGIQPPIPFAARNPSNSAKHCSGSSSCSRWVVPGTKA